MKRIILVLLIPIAFKAQDTIIKKAGEVILCKITKVTTANIFYTENKIGKTIPISETGYYSKPLQSQQTTSIPAKAEDCHVKREVDKFTNEVQLNADFPKWFRIIKYVKGGRATYYASLWTEGTTGNYAKKGAIILFEDGSKITKDEAEIDCDYRAGVMYDYTAFFPLNDWDLSLLTTKRTVGVRLFVVDREWGEKKGDNIKEQLNCLVNAN
jgi:hypothetical protein